jgi:N6-adenosine-specific RNA methylase IME4
MLPLPNGSFACITADPPWSFKSNSRAKPGRNAMRHYDCMTLDEIAALPVADIAADNAILWFWTPSPLLVIGAHIPIMCAWGFKPTASGFVWVKIDDQGRLQWGTGFTTRKNCEFCVIGKRGRSLRQVTDVHEVIFAPRRQHSRKPNEFYRRVDAAIPWLEVAE